MKRKEFNVVFYSDDEWYTSWYGCTKCGESSIFKGAKYCPGCGVKINQDSYNDK